MATGKRRLGRGLDKMIQTDVNEEKKSTKTPSVRRTAAKNETDKKETVKKQTAKKETVKKDTVKKETVKKDTTKKEATKKDTVKRTAEKKDAEKNEIVQKTTVKSTSTKLTTNKKTGENKTGNNNVSTDAIVDNSNISSLENENSGQIYLRVSEIEPNRNQPRKKFDKEALEELADSIKTHGLIQPIVVQKRDGYFEIIAGERRWRAAKLAKIKEVPVIIKEYTEREIMEVALIENLQRENLNPIEEAESYSKLIEEYGLIQEELAQRVSKSRTAITNSLRLLKLSKKVREMVISGKISGGHARALVAVEDEKLQFELATIIYENKLSVRETEKLIKNRLNAKPKKVITISPETEMLYRSVENSLKDIFSTRVSINAKNNGKGKIEIDYYSEEDLDRILGIIKGN